VHNGVIVNNPNVEKSKHILLIEDDKNDVELMMLALGECGLDKETVVISNGLESLDYLYCQSTFATRSNGNPALIFLDLNMPLMNGVDVLIQIRSDQNLKNIPVVVLSVTQDAETIKICRELGANDYVVKPINFKKFVSVVKELGTFWMQANTTSGETK